MGTYQEAAYLRAKELSVAFEQTRINREQWSNCTRDVILRVLNSFAADCELGLQVSVNDIVENRQSVILSLPIKPSGYRIVERDDSGKVKRATTPVREGENLILVRLTMVV